MSKETKQIVDLRNVSDEDLMIEFYRRRKAKYDGIEKVRSGDKDKLDEVRLGIFLRMKDGEIVQIGGFHKDTGFPIPLFQSRFVVHEESIFEEMVTLRMTESILGASLDDDGIHFDAGVVDHDMSAMDEMDLYEEDFDDEED